MTDIQSMIDQCTLYSQKWRFTFSAAKSQFVLFGSNPFKDELELFLDSKKLNQTDSLEILGITFHQSGLSSDHIANRVQKCRRAAYSLSSSGMCYPGVHTRVKSHVWQSVCLPTLLYGLDNISLFNQNILFLESIQGNILKSWLGLNKRQHHSKLIDALGLSPVKHLVKEKTSRLFSRLLQTETPAKKLNVYWLTKYLLTGYSCEGTLISRVINMGFNPLDLIANKQKSSTRKSYSEDGVVGSLSYLLNSENFVKPWSLEHMLVSLLTKAF